MPEEVAMDGSDEEEESKSPSKWKSKQMRKKAEVDSCLLSKTRNITPLKINIEPEHDGLEDDFHFPGASSQVPC